MKTVITYGTFDLFHVGHVRLLKRVRSLGDRLIVGCSTDEFNEAKGKKCIIPYENRAEVLLSCKYVDQVIPEENWEQKLSDIKEHNVQIFCIGDDWAGKFDFLSEVCEVYYLPRTDGISTTQLKDVMSLNKSEKMQGIRLKVQQALDLIDNM